MKLESQVCSIELAQKLKELGVKQESLYYYAHGGKLKTQDEFRFSYNVDLGDETMPYHSFEYYISQVNGGECYSAFTVAELGETLPWAIESDGTDYVLMIRATVDGSWSIAYICIQKLKRFNEIEFEDMNEADCKAKMLVYLLENNLIN